MIYSFGSINADYIYRVPRLPKPGETLAAITILRGLGGKGANQSVAAARAGAAVRHIGAVGHDGRWAVDELRGYGVETTHIAELDTPSGHAIIYVDLKGENCIVICKGANCAQSTSCLEAALSDAKRQDTLLVQNETNLQVEAARMAKAKGMKVIYSAAPFSDQAVQAVLPHVDLLIMNSVEASQLARKPSCRMIVTRGKDGVDLIECDARLHVPAVPAKAVDTTGAGDCFAGYLAAGLDQGMEMVDAIHLGVAAAALQIQRHGTASAVPTRQEVDAFLA
jgi:ribokinase